MKKSNGVVEHRLTLHRVSVLIVRGVIVSLMAIHRSAGVSGTYIEF